MKKSLVVVGFILFFFWQSVATQSLPEGNFTGGFWLNGNWVAVNFRLRQEKESLGGDADVMFPSNSRNIANETQLKFKRTK